MCTLKAVRSFGAGSVAACLLTLAVGAAFVRADAIAQWQFDEYPGGTVAPDTIGNHPGTLMGDAGFSPGGISGNCVAMSEFGNGYVTMGNFFDLTSGDFSIVAWLQMRPYDLDPHYVIAKHQLGSLNGYMLAVNQDGAYGADHLAWFYQSSDPNDTPLSTDYATGSMWHQIVGVYQAGATARIYVDGAPFEDQRQAIPIVVTPAEFLVGGVDTGQGIQSMLTGNVDEVQIYNHALTDNQVQFLYTFPASRVVALPGDMNCDGHVDFGDINPFVLAITDPEGYQAAYPNCDIMHADINMDSSVDFGDINPFVAILSH